MVHRIAPRKLLIFRAHEVAETSLFEVDSAVKKELHHGWIFIYNRNVKNILTWNIVNFELINTKSMCTWVMKGMVWVKRKIIFETNCFRKVWSLHSSDKLEYILSEDEWSMKWVNLVIKRQYNEIGKLLRHK